jgi:hypothetical protein
MIAATISEVIRDMSLDDRLIELIRYVLESISWWVIPVYTTIPISSARHSNITEHQGLKIPVFMGDREDSNDRIIFSRSL